MLFNCLWLWLRRLWKTHNKVRKENKDKRDRRNTTKILKNLQRSHLRKCKKLGRRIGTTKILRRIETDSIRRNKMKGNITPSWESAMSLKLRNKMISKKNHSIQSIISERNIMKKPLKTYFLKITNLKSMNQNSQRRPTSIKITKRINMIRTILNKSFRNTKAKNSSKMSLRRNLRNNLKQMKHKRFGNL